MSHSGVPLLHFIKPQWSAPSSIGALVTTRVGGMSAPPYDALNLGAHVGDLPENVKANRDLLKKFLPAEPLWLEQVHGNCVSTPAAPVSQADAIVTKEPGKVLAIMTADCLPVLFVNSKGTVIGAAHAGWRGLSAGILENIQFKLCVSFLMILMTRYWRGLVLLLVQNHLKWVQTLWNTLNHLL